MRSLMKGREIEIDQEGEMERFHERQREKRGITKEGEREIRQK
ncbi:unnamed protein product [Spirodela intermedia]|uniref:Uncharacterized protein n=1 Tax=Spirodela intermedia TaxID=51605 RepID=A0ABN7EBQ5_SPIIN|nr:unnamed protein product [Spirodela intermedia]